MTDEQLAAQLMRLHPDVYSVLPYGSAFKLLNESETLENSQSAQTQISRQIKAIHLTHHELIAWFHDFKEKNYQENYSQGKSKSSHYTLALSSRPLIVSCHDSNSIHAANKLAEIRLQQQRSPVIGIFLSPVLATESHPDSVPLGWETWSTLAQLADMPVIGLGGLSPRMFEKAEQYGAISIAGIRQFLKR